MLILIRALSPLGRCVQGSRCLYTHDPNSVAICKDFLQKGLCPAGDFCDLSHDLSPERTPTCLHFLRGRCSNNPCRYTHVRLKPSALVCSDFATLGYCEKGAQCPNRHVHECPAYANTGVCRDPKCRLPHPDSAGQIRQHNSTTNSTMNTTKTVATADTHNSGDVDPPGQEEEVDNDNPIDDDDDDDDDEDANFAQLQKRRLQSVTERQFLSQQDFVQF